MITNSNIQALIDDNVKLMNNAVVLNVSEDIDEEMENCKKTIKKLEICNSLQDKHIVAVSGEQGAGKSTIIRNIYEIPDDVLPITEGRGEKIPILVSEHDWEKFIYKKRFYKYDEMKKEYAISDVEISASEFKQNSQYPDEDVIYLELIAPRKFGLDKNAAFMLLPGFENDKEYWQAVIDFAISCADSCIMVYDKDMLSGDRINQAASRIENALKGSKPIYLITHSETMDDTQKEELLENSRNVFEVEEGEEDRFIFVVDQNRENNEAWIAKLRQVYDKYFNINRSQYQGEYIEEIIQELRESYTNIKYGIQNYTDDIQVTLESKPLLKEFEKECKKQRKSLEANLRSQTDIQFNESIDKLNNAYNSGDKATDNANLAGRVQKRVKNWIVGETVHDHIQTQRFLGELLVDEQNNSRVIVALNNALTASGANVLESKMEEIKSERGEDETTILIGEAINIMKNENIMALSEKSRFKTLAQMIHRIAIHYYTEQVKALLESNMKNLSEISLKDPDMGEKLADSSLKSLNEISNNTVKVLGITSAIDFIPDQKFNLPQELSKIFGVKPEIITRVGIGVYMLILADKTIKNFNKREMQQYMAYQNAINECYSQAMRICLSQYDAYMESIRERIEEYLEKQYNVGKNSIKVHNTQVCITNLENRLEDIQGRIYEERAIQ